MKSRAIIFAAADRVELGDVEIGSPGEGRYLIETLYTAISPGTELRNLSGKQAGMVFPCVPGYSCVGRIVERGAGTRLDVGTLVFTRGTETCSITRMWGGHVQYGIQPETGVWPVPTGVDSLEAVLAKLSSIALHGVRCAPPWPQARVAVVGLGPIGQFAARHYDISGAQVLALDLVPWRVELLQKAGITAVAPDGEIARTILKHFPDGADFIVDCTGVPAVIPQLIPAAKDFPWADYEMRQTTYVIQGSYPADIALPYWDAFMKELKLVLPRDNSPADYTMSLERMSSCKLRCRELVSDVRRPEDAAATFAELKDRNSRLMTVAFNWM